MKQETEQVIKTAVVDVTPDINPIVNLKLKAHTAAFTFTFPSGRPGTLMVTKISDYGWIPSSEIARITIEFK